MTETLFLKQAFMNGWFFVLKNIFFIWPVKLLPHKLKLLILKSNCIVRNFLRKLGKSRKQTPWRLGSHLYRKQHDNSRKNISCRFVQRKGDEKRNLNSKPSSASYKLHDLRQVFNLCKRIFPGQNNDHNT